MVAGNTLLKFFSGQMLDQLREDGAARVHPSLFHPEDRPKEVNPALFQFKSFLRRSCVIMLIFNGLEWPPEILAGQQWFGMTTSGILHGSAAFMLHAYFKPMLLSVRIPIGMWRPAGTESRRD